MKDPIWIITKHSREHGRLTAAEFPHAHTSKEAAVREARRLSRLEEAPNSSSSKPSRSPFISRSR